MLKLSRLQGRTARSIAAVATLGAAAVLAFPTAASAAPTGSLDTGSVDTGSATAVVNDAINRVLAGTGSAGALANDIVTSVLNGSGSAFVTNEILSGGGSLAPTQPCNNKRISGGAGVTSTNHDLGRSGPTSFLLSYETENIPDQIEVRYEGRVILNTGYVGDAINQGTGSVVVNVPAGSSTSVLVTVTGPDSTIWEYTVHCPA